MEVKKLKEAANDNQSTWKNERHKLSITIADKEQCIMVCIETICIVHKFRLLRHRLASAVYVGLEY